MKIRALLLVIVTGILLTGCGDDGSDLSVSYQVPLVPLKITVDHLGKISLSASYAIATPIGTFDLNAGHSVASIRRESTTPVLVVKIDDRAEVFELEPESTFEVNFEDSAYFRFVSLEREEDHDWVLVLESLPTASFQTLALDFMLEPTFGYAVLDNGFGMEDVALLSGGEVDVNRYIDANCYGYAAVAPDFDLYWDGSGELSFYFEADNLGDDTTLIINDPDGNWYCNDDVGEDDLNPGIYFSNAKAGLYDVWIGSYDYGYDATGVLWMFEPE